MESLRDSDPPRVSAYRLLGRLAVGGMGIVYRGESPGGRPVAVKLIRPELAREPEFRARFRREVEAARLVGGFHTAAVVAADPDADPPWVVTEYVDGPSLEELVKRDGPVSQAAVRRLAAGLAEGLNAIHSRGLVHRDVKPRNIIMASDGPKIIDFGIAKPVAADSDPGLTATGTVVGTPAFLSPEQLEGTATGPASDIFSLGSVLAFAACGRAPFDVGGFEATSYAIVHRPPVLPLADGPLRDIITACLAKAPDSRPTAGTLLTYLYNTRPATAPDPRPATAPDPPPPPAAVPARVRATVSRRALAQRAAARRDPVDRAAQARTPAVVKPAPPQLQVRPMGHGWRLVTAGADGRWLATANGDGTVAAWLAGSGLPVRSWPAGARVRAMAAGPGDLLVVAGDDGRVTAWDVATGTARRYLPDTVPGLTGTDVRVRCLAVDAAGGWLSAAVEGRLLVWDVADPGEPLLAAALPCTAPVTALAFDDTGWQLAAGDEAGHVRAWNLAQLTDAVPANTPAGGTAFDAAPLTTAWVDPPGTLPRPGRPHAGPVLALAWDQGRERWLSVGQAGPDDWAADASLRAAALSPDGGFAAMIDDDSGRVSVGRLDQPGSSRELDGTGLVVTGVAFTAAGMLALGASDGSLRLWHPADRAQRVITASGSPVTAVAASRDGTRLVVGDKRAELRCFNAVNGSLTPGWAADSPEPAQCLAFLPDGKRFAANGDEVRVWNAAGGTPAGILPGRTGRARAVAADRDGTRIAAAWAETVVTVWQDGRLRWQLTGHTGAVLAVAFGPRHGLLVSAADDETIRTWDLAAGRETACHAELGYRATVLAASPSGTTLAAGCADGTVRLYEAGPPGPLPHWADAAVLAGHAHGITALSFDVSGRLLASASRDGTARIWDLAARTASTVLLPGAAAVASPDGTWHSLGGTDGLIWQAAGLTRVPLPLLEEVT